MSSTLTVTWLCDPIPSFLRSDPYLTCLRRGRRDSRQGQHPGDHPRNCPRKCSCTEGERAASSSPPASARALLPWSFLQARNVTLRLHSRSPEPGLLTAGT